MPKYIRVVEPIQPVTLDGDPLKDSDGKAMEPITFQQFVRERAFDQECVKTFEGLTRAMEIVRSLDKVVGEKAGVWELNDAHWRHLKDSVEKPSGGYVAWAWNILPFCAAVVDAKDQPPAAVEK